MMRRHAGRPPMSMINPQLLLQQPGFVLLVCSIRSRVAGAHTESIPVCKVPLALYGATFQLLEGTLVSYTPPKLFTCCQRHMPAPQPRPRRLPWSPPPSAPAFSSRPSAAPRAAPRPGPTFFFTFLRLKVPGYVSRSTAKGRRRDIFIDYRGYARPRARDRNRVGLCWNRVGVVCVCVDRKRFSRFSSWRISGAAPRSPRNGRVTAT
eukprot:COSAG04_NODE_3174_length_3090_cov_1.916750_5_plen_207_part_00